MKDDVIISRYAEAFVAYARKTLSNEEVIEEVRKIKSLFRDTPELKQFFFNKEIAPYEKYSFVNTILNKVLREETRSLWKLLVEKGRIAYILDIADYVRVTYAHGNAVNAVLTSAYFLDFDVIKEIKSILEEKLGVRLNLYIEFDTDLLGGVQIKIGNKVLDGSLRKRILDLKHKWTALKVG